ncbi:hypothetical protein [Candidatus Neptunichlamydia sp. REUL1]|uniref:hypothetical protein n=1 Tax=Candidatus Neptunichlamydia sp. REUL1 TaxID=3064277 RepID=UPI00292CD946|nr:hypothetical protein [Candidatus Neptunochlamydia sp. REUL1]
MSMDVGSINTVNKFFVMNGVANNDPSRGTLADQLQSSLDLQSDAEISIRNIIDVIPNDTATLERMAADALLTGAAVLGGLYTLKKESEEDADKFKSRAIGVLSTAAGLGAAYDYVQIQKEKNDLADALAQKVSNFLNNEQHSGNAVLVLHSQAADIGYRALQNLRSLKDRIHVVTLGGMVTVPDEFANSVINFQFKEDLVTNVVAKPFDWMVRQIDRDLPRTINHSHGGEHSVRAYLDHNDVKSHLQSLRS